VTSFKTSLEPLKSRFKAENVSSVLRSIFYCALSTIINFNSARETMHQ